MSQQLTGAQIAEIGQAENPRDIRKTAIDPNFWYPLARSKDLKRGKTLAVQFAGDPIVLVRPKDGPVFALENRCAHRQVPLNVGVVSERSIKCAYHGWIYDDTGQVHQCAVFR